jgi:hypothetical protein
VRGTRSVGAKTFGAEGAAAAHSARVIDTCEQKVSASSPDSEFGCPSAARL